MGLVCILFVLCVVLSAVLPDRGSRRSISDSGPHIANVRPLDRPWDWSRDDEDLIDPEDASFLDTFQREGFTGWELLDGDDWRWSLSDERDHDEPSDWRGA